MKSTAKQEHNLNFKRNSYIPKMCVDPWPVGSTTKPTLKVCEHNRVTHASMAPDKGHLEELGWITCVAWRKQRREENRQDSMHRSQGSTYRSPIKHDTHVIGPGWTLGINWQDSSKRRESDVAVTLARPLHVSNVGQSKENRKVQASDTYKW